MPHKAAQPFPICASTSFRVPAHGHGAFNVLTVRPIGSQQEVSDSGLRRQVDESPQQMAATAWSERCHSTPASRRMRLSEPASAFGLAFPWSIPSRRDHPTGRIADTYRSGG